MQKGKKAAIAAVIFIVCCVMLGTAFADVTAKGGKAATDKK